MSAKSYRFVVAVVALGALSLSNPARAITRSDATPPMFTQSLVENPTENWKGVGYFRDKFGRHSTGVLISKCHVLTAAHIFFDLQGNGMGPQIVGPRDLMFKLDEEPEAFRVSKIEIMPGYKDDRGRGQGHRKVGLDLAVVTLAKSVPNAEPYAYNTGQVPDERDPALDTVKVGFGWPGNGERGSVGAFFRPLKRFCRNTVDQFGDGADHGWLKGDTHNRRDPPPANTLAYDFDDHRKLGTADENASNMKNAIDETRIGAVGPEEGCPASGDSGGPLFQRPEEGEPWIVVGITSSGSDSRSRYGTVAYDTRVLCYTDFIGQAVAADCPE